MDKSYYILLGCMFKLTDVSEKLHNDLESLKTQIFENEDEEVNCHIIPMSELAQKYRAISDMLRETASFLQEQRDARGKDTHTEDD